VTDLPVGLNLQEHLMVPVTMKLSKPISNFEATVKTWPNILNYVFFKRGPLSSQSLEAMAFTQAPTVKHSSQRFRGGRLPPLQFHFIASPFKEDEISKERMNVSFPIKEDYHGVTLLPTLLHPTSKGSVSLRSSNPIDPPVLNYNFLEAADDLELLVDGMKSARRILGSPAFDSVRLEKKKEKDASKSSEKTSPVGSWEVVDPSIPYPPESDDYLREWIRKYVLHVFHPTGTCRMGRVEDPETVVDSQLRVKGVIGLRVADCSIMPEIVSGNTNAPAIMIGEKASDIIKQFWSSVRPVAKY